MASERRHALFSRFVSDYGMLFVLLLLGAFFSYVTWGEQHPTGAAAAESLAPAVVEAGGPGARVLILAGDSDEDRAFAASLRERLAGAGLAVAGAVTGQPADARRALEAAALAGGRLDLIAADHVAAGWAVLDDLGRKLPALAGARVLSPGTYRWSAFLKPDNLTNIADQITIIAIVAVGMTMVIITGGIDLSVGSLIALAAVTAALLIRDVAGAREASAWGMVACCLAGIAASAAMGLFSGLMVSRFSVPPFIATLGMMLVASGLAYLLAQGQSIYEIPASFGWLGIGSLAVTVSGVTLFRLPHAVVLMAALYVAAAVVMARTVLGRHIYAVGGNAEAARLSGVPVRRVLLAVYTACGALAGLGGIVMASQFHTGAPKYGETYELYVIAAVVLGGTSLSGGRGKVLGTLIGAFIIAVIRNGMNLTGVTPYTQKVVLGLVILGAVLLDRLKSRGWGRRRGRAPA